MESFFFLLLNKCAHIYDFIVVPNLKNEYVKSIICIGEYCFPISMSGSYISTFIDDAVALKCVTLTLNTYFTHTIYTRKSPLVWLQEPLVQKRMVLLP